MFPTVTTRVLFAVAVSLAALSAPADAQWKWKDKTGRVQYSDLPPPQGTPEADILSRPSSRATIAPRQTTAPLAGAPAAATSAVAAASGPALRPPTIDPDLEAKRKKAEEDVQAKRKADEQRVAAAKAENCKRAQDALRTLESGQRIARTNDKGEREFLDDKQRADETQRVRNVASADCRQ